MLRDDEEELPRLETPIPAVKQAAEPPADDEEKDLADYYLEAASRNESWAYWFHPLGYWY